MPKLPHDSFAWRRIRAVEKRTVKWVVQHPRGSLHNSGLLHFLLRFLDLEALLRHPKIGYPWEGMVIDEIIRRLNRRGISFDH